MAVALKEIVRPDREHNIKVALGPARASRIAFAGVADARAFLHSRRHFHGELQFLVHARFATAGCAGISDDRTGAAAGSAGAGYGEKSLLVANLSPALALRANAGSAS